MTAMLSMPAQGYGQGMLSSAYSGKMVSSQTIPGPPPMSMSSYSMGGLSQTIPGPPPVSMGSLSRGNISQPIRGPAMSSLGSYGKGNILQTVARPPVSMGYGKGGFSSQTIPDPPAPPAHYEDRDESSLWENVFGQAEDSAEEEEEFTPPMANPMMTAPRSMAMMGGPAQVQQPDMMPIPWQTKKETMTKEEKSHGGFDRMSTAELLEMAATRNSTIANLEREIEELNDSDERHEQRLASLEKQFGALTQGSELKVKAPLLAKIRQVVRDSHLLDHRVEIEKMKEHVAGEDEAEQWTDLDPWQYMHSQNLVMGRGYLGLDKNFIATKQWNDQCARDQHPVVHRMHYAGHTAKAAEDVESIFVKEAGVYKKQPLHPAPYRNQFWLSLDGPSREDAHAAREATKAELEDPVARRIMRQDQAGTGEDAQAVDWLGQRKRGDMIGEHPPAQNGFVMPSWMY